MWLPPLQDARRLASCIWNMRNGQTVRVGGIERSLGTCAAGLSFQQSNGLSESAAGGWSRDDAGPSAARHRIHRCQGREGQQGEFILHTSTQRDT